jgi:pSer/pThr/pTyr-binding forkhead associated (FHA) protein
MLGFGLIGAATGLMIGLVELVAREAWVKLQSGPIAGKEFVLYRNPTWIGSSPKCEIYLFKDSQVAPRHAAIHKAGEHYELEDQGSAVGTLVGGTRVRRCRLRDRDRIQVGQTDLEFRFRDE